MFYTSHAAADSSLLNATSTADLSTVTISSAGLTGTITEAVDWSMDYDRLYRFSPSYPSYEEYEELKKRVEKLEELLTSIYHAKDIGDLV